jgi:hypothetical protein
MNKVDFIDSIPFLSPAHSSRAKLSKHELIGMGNANVGDATKPYVYGETRRCCSANQPSSWDYWPIFSFAVQQEGRKYL